MNIGSNKSFGGGQSRPSHSPSAAPDRGGTIQKGFGSSPSAARVQSIVQHAAPSAFSAPTSSSPVVTSDQLPTNQPLVFAIFLLGPGCSALRTVIEESAPYFDEASGDRLHWILIGHPQRSRAFYRSYLEERGVSLDALDQEWRAAHADRADDADVIAEENMKLVRRFGIEPEKLPTVLFAFPGRDVGTAMRLPLGGGVATSQEHARGTVSLLCKHFSERSLFPIEHSTKTAHERRPELAIERAIMGFPLSLEDGTGADALHRDSDTKKSLFLLALSRGLPVKEAEKQAGISRQAVNKDKWFGPRAKQITAARRSMAALRPGSKEDGRVQAADATDDALDGDETRSVDDVTE